MTVTCSDQKCQQNTKNFEIKLKSWNWIDNIVFEFRNALTFDFNGDPDYVQKCDCVIL